MGRQQIAWRIDLSRSGYLDALSIAAPALFGDCAPFRWPHDGLCRGPNGCAGSYGCSQSYGAFGQSDVGYALVAEPYGANANSTCHGAERDAKSGDAKPDAARRGHS